MKPYDLFNGLRGSSLRAVQRMVALAVAMRCGDGGRCYASVQTLGEDAGCDGRTVRRVLGELVSLGVLCCEFRTGGTTVYTIPDSALDRIEYTPDRGSGGADRGSAPDTLSPRTEDPGGRILCPPPPDRGSGGADRGSADSIPYSSPDPTPEENQPGVVVSLRVLGQDEQAAQPEQHPAPKWARVRGASPPQVASAVLRALTEIRGRPAHAERCSTDAAHVIKLWKALGQPPVDEFADELVLVAQWARESSDPLAENDIRGRRPDGSTWGADRSRSVSTLCVHSRWGDRLAAAQREQEEGGQTGPYVRGDHPGVASEGRRLTPEERKAWTWD